MSTILVRRTEFTGEHTCGLFYIDGVITGFTIEPPWKNNAIFVSCIPPGDYILRPGTSPRVGECLRVENVPHREGILFHAGNFASETHGCILPGLRIGFMGGERCVFNSRKAMHKLFAFTGHDPDASFKLMIIETAPTI